MAEENSEVKVRRIMERNETLRWFWGCFTVGAIICSLIWAIALCTYESYKHPVIVDNKVESSTTINRK
jgi:hypothetical protein